MKKKLTLLLTVVLTTTFLWSQEQNPWTHFRGSNLNGISLEQGFPVTWNDSTHIRWKFKDPGKGWSSPIVFGNQVWLTTANRETREMRAICLDLQSGKELHNVLVFKPESLFRIHAINSYATPTGAIESGYIYLHYGRYGTACLNSSTGEKVWERTDIQCEHIQGPGSSLLIYKDKLIVHMEGTDVQQILALDKRTGKTIWMAERPKELYEPLDDIGKKAYVTPIVIHIKGRDLLISNGSSACIAYDAETGNEVWRILQGEDSTISMPVEGEGLVYFYTSFVTGPDGIKYAELFAVDPDGSGDLTSSHIRWRMKAPILQLSTPVVAGDRLFTVDASGEFFSLNTQSGQINWSTKLKGKYHSSPVYADGYLYISSIRGETFVYSAGDEPKLVSKNRLKGEIWATPAFVGGAILLRTSEYLYKIQL